MEVGAIMARKKDGGEIITCPSCGSNDVLRIMYGFPSEDMIRAEARQEIILGGCCVREGSPEYHCHSCEEEFGVTSLFCEGLIVEYEGLLP
jgi:DNA-directed RNA polymerase subunit RPC12/RpoP